MKENLVELVRLLFIILNVFIKKRRNSSKPERISDYK